MMRKSSILIAITMFLLTVAIVWRSYSFPVLKSNTNNTVMLSQNLDFQFSSQRSTPNHPVFVSMRYHFEYTPLGNYSYNVGQPHGTEQFEVGISTSTGDAGHGIELHIYRNDVNLTPDNVQTFRTWRKDNIYNNPNDVISGVTINGLPFYAASQTDGINSQSDYYYHVEKNFIYMFIFFDKTPNAEVKSALQDFHLTV